VSRPLPGAVHDLTAARIWGLVRELAAAGLIVLADKGYIGAGQHIRTPYRGRANQNRRRRPTGPTPSSAVPASEPTPSSRPGRSCATRCCPGTPGNSPKAIHVLQARDHRMKRLTLRTACSVCRGPCGRTPKATGW
jgi:hypothetical protein